MQNRRGKDATRRYFCIFLLISSDKPCVGQPTQTHYTYCTYMLYKACSDEEAKKTALSPLSPLLCIVRAIYSFCLLRIPPKVQQVYTICISLYRSIYTHKNIYANSYQKKACRECIAHNHFSCTLLFI